MPTHKYAKTGRKYREMDTHFTKVHGSVGFRGYFAGPKVHIIDYYALAEPLLARLPARYKKKWRIGHFVRVVPPGYQQTAGTEQNRITDKDLAEFYDFLSVIIKGPLWTRERWAAIWKMNLGAYDHLIDRDWYRLQGMKSVSRRQTDVPKDMGTAWNSPGNSIFSLSDPRIDLAGRKQAERIDVSLNSNNTKGLRL